jgi:hypothetical protein
MSPRQTTDPLKTAARFRANSENIAKQGRRDYSGLDDTALVPITLTTASARDAARQEAEDRGAARGVARYTMHRPHACTGGQCASEDHGTGRQDMHQALAILDLLHYATGPGAAGLGGPGERVREKDGIGRWKKQNRKRSKPGQPASLGEGWLGTGLCGELAQKAQ